MKYKACHYLNNFNNKQKMKNEETNDTFKIKTETKTKVQLFRSSKITTTLFILCFLERN